MFFYKPISSELFFNEVKDLKKKNNLLFIFFLISIFYVEILLKKKFSVNNNRKIIEGNYFVIDSDNLENVQSHFYGYSVSKKGILTDNYFKEIGEYDLPEPQGAFVLVRKIENKIVINQDFYGSYGIYIYEKKESNYFALSNSFLLLQEYLFKKQNLSFNKDYADNLIISSLCSFSMEETLINEIHQIPSNSFIVINKKYKNFKIYFIDYKENTIPLESEEGIKLIDNWVDKWGYILRSLKRQTDNISLGLSGGFDTRTVLSILLNSGINLNDINVFSLQDKVHDHETDLKIAKRIASKFGLKINNYTLLKKGNILNLKDKLYNALYTKLGFHVEFTFNSKFYKIPLFSIAGSNGESLRGMPNSNISEYIKKIFYNNITGHKLEFFDSSMRIFNRSISFLKRKRTFSNDYEISSYLYDKAIGKNHFGKFASQEFMANIYTLQPLMDPDIKKIKFNINEKSSHDLLSYIYVRFAHDLINFPFQGNRKLELESIKKAKSLNKKLIPYVIKSDYNKNFYIDYKRNYFSSFSGDNKNVNDYLIHLFRSSRFIKILKEKYDNNILYWANNFSRMSNYFPFKHHFAFLAIAITLENLSVNEKYNKNSTNLKIHKKLFLKI